MSCSQSLNQNTRISPKWLQGLESRWCHLPKNGGINVKVGGRGTEKGTQEDKLRAQVLGSRPESSSAHKGMAGGGRLGAVTRDSWGRHTSGGTTPSQRGSSVLLLAPVSRMAGVP